MSSCVTEHTFTTLHFSAALLAVIIPGGEDTIIHPQIASMGLLSGFVVPLLVKYHIRFTVYELHSLYKIYRHCHDRYATRLLRKWKEGELEFDDVWLHSDLKSHYGVLA